MECHTGGLWVASALESSVFPAQCLGGAGGLEDGEGSAASGCPQAHHLSLRSLIPSELNE